MRNVKKLVAVIAVVGVLGAAGAVYAADLKAPADIAASLSGKSVEDVNKEKAAGKTFGTIAKEAGKLDEFKTQMLNQRKAVLDQRIKDGKLTQQRADEIYNAIKNNQASCDGSGSAKIGKQFGAGFGNAQGQGIGNGKGMGRGAGMGNRGSCGLNR